MQKCAKKLHAISLYIVVAHCFARAYIIRVNTLSTGDAPVCVHSLAKKFIPL